jgi:exopolysaccharide/PEP-CTERM locus tyrosine autokinase
MGKIADALDKYRKERRIQTERLAPGVAPAPARGESAELLTDKADMTCGLSPKLIVLSEPDSMDAENFKLLRAQILFPKEGRPPRTIMVTSALPGEGKTFIATNLAASIALGLNEHVLLVDCDFRRPQAHEMVGCSNEKGLHEFLLGKEKMPDLLAGTGVEKLTLLPAGGPSRNPSELLSSPAMRQFLREVKGRYQDRYVILDASPCHVTAEVGFLAKYVETVLFVVMAQKSPREAIRKSIEALGKEKILGIVFNGYAGSYKSYLKYYRKYYRGTQ